MDNERAALNGALSFAEQKELLANALLEQGILTRKELAALDPLMVPHLTFKQAVSLRYGIPIELLDRIDFEKVVITGLIQELRNRLRSIARKDRFAKNLDIDSYIAGVETRVLHRETRSIEARVYDSENEDVVHVDSSEVTEATVEVTLATSDGQAVLGKLRISHDSHCGQLDILQEEEDLKSALYYSLRQAFTKKI